MNVALDSPHEYYSIIVYYSYICHKPVREMGVIGTHQLSDSELGLELGGKQ